MKKFTFYILYSLLFQTVFSQTSILDSCFISPVISTSFPATTNITNLNADMCSWNGSGWTGSWPAAGLTLPPPTAIIGTRAIWSGPNHWTTGGEGFGLRLGTPLVAGQSYTFTFTYVRHGWTGAATFYPNFRTNNTGAVTGGTLVGTLPAVGTSWTTASITFVATAAQAGHTFITIHAYDTGGFVLACSPTATVLPITEVLFKAVSEKNLIRLDWKSEYALPQETFELERSLDGVQFVSIYKTSANQTDYTYTDTPNRAGSWFYRLRKSDKDGNITYYSTVEATMEDAENLSIKNIYPNPAQNNENLTVTIYSATQNSGTLELYDMLGKKILSQPATWEAGTQQFILPLQNVEKGLYQLVIISQKERISQKIWVQ
jgi:hypothetical protein